MRKSGSWVLTLLLVASACASYSHTDRAQTQLAFGTDVAKQGHWREAAFRFEQAIAKEPGNARAHNNLAVVLMLTGRAEEAAREARLAEKAGVPPSPRLLEEIRKRRLEAKAPPE